MFKRLFRINHWRARARYWRGQAETAKREVARLQLSLLAERYRNMQREDTFASAAVLGARNMWGLAPRTGPATSEQPKATPSPANPFNLSGADLMEFDLEWKPLAEARGVSAQEAKREFMMELERRRGNRLIDDPYTTTN